MPTADSSASKEVVTAALLVIGGKILSGRTKDQNIGYIAEYRVGIDLKEVRVVGDEETAIVDALNALRRRCTYVFTTGGIGPTHGDITADCVAKAFGVPIDTDPRSNQRDRQVQSRGYDRQLSVLRSTARAQRECGAARPRCTESSHRPNARSRTCWSECGEREHNQRVPDLRPPTAKHGFESHFNDRVACLSARRNLRPAAA